MPAMQLEPFAIKKGVLCLLNLEIKNDINPKK